MWPLLSDVLKESGMITAFVLIIMLFIEVLNIATQGAWSKTLARSPLGQIVLAAVLGSLPGCFGGFAVVSMYSHGILHFGALMAAMISNIGDEAFVMLVQMPDKALMLMLILLLTAILVGWITWRLTSKNKSPQSDIIHFELHHEDRLSLKEMAKNWKQHLKHMTFARALLLMGILAFIFILIEHPGHEHLHQGEIHLPLNEAWFHMIFLVLACILLIITVIASDHFLEHHLWEHVIKHHFLKIFFWVFAALLVIALINEQVMALDFISKNQTWMLLLAVLIGLIPQSGPHLIFVSLYLSGHIPFAILLANSIVQDGHSALPLFAEKKKAFLMMKFSKAFIAILIALLMLGLH